MTQNRYSSQAWKYHMPKKLKIGNKGGMRKLKRRLYSKRVYIYWVRKCGLVSVDGLFIQGVW